MTSPHEREEERFIEEWVALFEERFGGFIATQGKREKQDQDNEWFRVLISAAIEYGKEVERAENIKLSDDIEVSMSSDFSDWRAFKRFRNVLRDKSNHQS